MKILVADDSRVMRRIIVRALRQAGYGGHDIVEAENGRETVDLVATERPDLVVSDWHMPVLNGIDALAELRASGSTVPFGFVTSDGSDSVRGRACAAGALFLIAKPFRAEALRDALTGSCRQTMSVHLPGAGAGARPVRRSARPRRPAASPALPSCPDPAAPATVATYVDDQECVRAVISCDLDLSARAGAAIGLVPPSGADRAIRSGCVDGALGENLAEVLDVAATLFERHRRHPRPAARAAPGR